mmetsp:Transcript_57391/g.136415  ORF Transcript_57391/g.136415 Transcript_57391/m.136415 type:complete len:365 (-) Transcript_57391:155-1249(-)
MAREPDMPVDLVLVRHGESEGNLYDMLGKKGKELNKSEEADMLRKCLHGKHTSEWRLTDLGRHQARRAGKLIQEEILDKEVGRFDKFYCSAFVRAMETASCMNLPRARYQVSIFLREKDSMNEWERAGVNLVSSTPWYKSAAPDSMKMSEQAAFYGLAGDTSESPADLLIRIRLFLGELRHQCPGQRVIIVCHRHVMKAFEIILRNVPPSRYAEVWGEYTPNCIIDWYSRRDSHGNVHMHYARYIHMALKSPNDINACASEANRKELNLMNHKEHDFSPEELREMAEKFPQRLNTQDLWTITGETSKATRKVPPSLENWNAVHNEGGEDSAQRPNSARKGFSPRRLVGFTSAVRQLTPRRSPRR